ncbi:hypothetical protein SPHINGO8BC_50811 [Sphingobacterium multivorum]|uniref:Uncharacterized protein n=1 Tax=Sphingobacterium multivorum TaxID=28454 RepID=A0A654CBU7_SPHMU|nr:hypothetical protein SPHINGO8BC_50811 [Sphingobacterium multivorum]
MFMLIYTAKKVINGMQNIGIAAPNKMYTEAILMMSGKNSSSVTLCNNNYPIFGQGLFSFIYTCGKFAQ